MASSAPPPTVLLVDDTSDTRELMRTVLEIAGLRTAEAATGGEALVKAPEADLIVLDVRLPDIDGYEVCRRLRGNPGTARVPVLQLSGVYRHAEDKIRGLEEGADGYLTKPVDPAELVATVKALLRIRQSEVELERREHYFRALIEDASDLVGVLSANGTIRYASPAHERILGYRPEGLIGKNALDLVHPEEQPAALAVFGSMTAPGSSATLEFRFRHRDGTWRRLEGIGRNLLHDPVIRGVVVNSRDITDRSAAEEALRRSEEHLRQAQKMEAVGRLAGGIAHDFNNLLAVIAGRAELALPRLPADARVRRDIELIQKTARRASRLTRQLLAFSRKQILRPIVLDLNEVVAGLGPMLQRMIGEDIDLVVRQGEALGRVVADPGQVEQVAMNLCLNARDAMPQGGQLVLETKGAEIDADGAAEHLGARPGRYVALSVSDSGVGMSAETLSHVFEPFFTTKAPGKGTGLGLATVYGIVEQSGGFIDVHSRPDHGTTFTVYLPRTDAPLTPNGASEAPATRGSETILLVEDEEDVRQAVHDMLREYGYTVLEAANASEGLDIAGTYRYPVHLLLTDVVMPHGSGRLLAEQLQAQRPETRVLFMTGYADDATLRHGVSQAEVALIEKPFSPPELARKVRQVLDAPEVS